MFLELLGFIEINIPLQIADLLSYDSSKSDQTLVYILTLGVVESYRNLGIGRAFLTWYVSWNCCHPITNYLVDVIIAASSLIHEVMKYASSIPTCRAVYLHVISYNNPAIHLYKKMSFKCVRRLHGFYLINGQHYDSYLFVYYVNGGRSPCSPL